jgi:hypothetical protein
MFVHAQMTANLEAHVGLDQARAGPVPAHAEADQVRADHVPALVGQDHPRAVLLVDELRNALKL